MVWHIRIGKLAWCSSPYARRDDLFLVAHVDGITLACCHVSQVKAQKMVQWLQRHGLDFVRVCEGMCGQGESR